MKNPFFSRINLVFRNLYFDNVGRDSEHRFEKNCSSRSTVSLKTQLDAERGSGMAQWLYVAVTQGPERRFEFSEG